MENKQTLWCLLIQADKSQDTGIIGYFYLYADHLGEALDKAISHSKQCDFNYNHCLMAASPLESVETLPHKITEIADGVFMKQGRYTYPIKNKVEEKPLFIAPTGIVNSIYETEYDYELIKEAFTAFNADDEGFFKFELVLNKEKVNHTFFEAMSILPSITLFSIFIKDHWDNHLPEWWVAEHLKDKKSIEDFLLKHQSDTLENGLIAIRVHASPGSAELQLDDHKKLLFKTKDVDLFHDFVGAMIDLGFEQTHDLYDLEFGYYHFHYRPANSLPRAEFRHLLADNNFQYIKGREKK